MSNKIIIVAGDPNSINSEIIYKTWKHLDKTTKNKIYLIASFKLFEHQFKKLKKKIYLSKVNNLMSRDKSNSLKVIDIPVKFENPFNVSKSEATKYLSKCFN